MQTIVKGPSRMVYSAAWVEVAVVTVLMLVLLALAGVVFGGTAEGQLVAPTGTVKWG